MTNDSKLEKGYILLKNLNTALSMAIILLGLYLVFFPLLPEVELNIKKLTSKPPALYSDSNNKLLISKIYLDTDIFQGEDHLEDGPVFLDEYDLPNNKGVKVLAGHRFQYIFGSKTFYHFDKIENEDEIEISWEGKKYEYKVIGKFEVEPEKLGGVFEEDRDQNILYIYTCTPLWTAQKRLIIKAIEKE